MYGSLLLPPKLLAVACVYFQAKQKKKENLIFFHSLDPLFFLLGFAYILPFFKQSQIDARFGNHKRNESIIFGAVFGAFKSKTISD